MRWSLPPLLLLSLLGACRGEAPSAATHQLCGATAEQDGNAPHGALRARVEVGPVGDCSAPISGLLEGLLLPPAPWTERGLAALLEATDGPVELRQLDETLALLDPEGRELAHAVIEAGWGRAIADGPAQLSEAEAAARGAARGGWGADGADALEGLTAASLWPLLPALGFFEQDPPPTPDCFDLARHDVAQRSQPLPAEERQPRLEALIEGRYVDALLPAELGAFGCTNWVIALDGVDGMMRRAEPLEDGRSRVWRVDLSRPSEGEPALDLYSWMHQLETPGQPEGTDRQEGAGPGPLVVGGRTDLGGLVVGGLPWFAGGDTCGDFLLSFYEHAPHCAPTSTP